jgi:GDP-4-dehydro-6-deoxy-D-mannose reductase
LNILITGISGFVGGHLAEFIVRLATSHNIYGTTLGPIPDYFSQFDNKFIELTCNCNLTNKDNAIEVVRHSQPEIVFHLAGIASIADAWQDAERVLTNNIVGQLNILEAVRIVKPDAKILVVSSADVYGKIGMDEIPVTENNDLRPCSPYSVSKLAQEHLCYQYRDNCGLQTIIVRPFNHIGPRQQGNFVVPNFARQIAAIEANRQEPVLHVGNLASERDFTDVRDIVEAYWLLAVMGTPGETYNVASGSAIKIEELLEILLGYSKTRIDVRQDPSLMRPSDTPIMIGSAKKLEADTGWKTKRDIKQTLLETLNYYRSEIIKA